MGGVGRGWVRVGGVLFNPGLRPQGAAGGKVGTRRKL